MNDPTGSGVNTPTKQQINSGLSTTPSTGLPQSPSPIEGISEEKVVESEREDREKPPLSQWPSLKSDELSPPPGGPLSGGPPLPGGPLQGGPLSGGPLASQPEGIKELSHEVVIGDLKIRVGIRKQHPAQPWPRWAVQCLDMDGSELLIDTMDITQAYVPIPPGNKAVTLSRVESQPGNPMYPPPPDQCDCADCKRGMMMGEKRRYADEDDSGDDQPLDDAPRRHPDYNRMYPAPVDCEDTVPYMPPPTSRGGRPYTEEEKRALKAAKWPLRIKPNGLPTIWCHSCYLQKRIFKIVSPLSPKAGIVYFRHQQCNTSYHKGEVLPKHIVKQYHEYYRNNRSRPLALTNGPVSPQPSLTPPPSRLGGSGGARYNGPDSSGQHRDESPASSTSSRGPASRQARTPSSIPSNISGGDGTSNSYQDPLRPFS